MLINYPLPTTEDIFNSFNGGQKFFKLDLADAYLLIMLDDESKQYALINSHKGSYQYSVLCFDISLSPAILQEVIGKLLEGIPGTTCYLKRTMQNIY